MKTTAALTLLILSLGGAAAHAAVTFDWATVGNPGNAADWTGFGAVDYTYRISKHEVINAQYTEFLNAVDPTGANPLALYNSNMSSNANGGINFNGGAANGSKYEIKSGRDNNPVVFVSFFDAMRFTNWLENGQGSGDTESGVYTIANALDEVRNPNAAFFIPSEDEWYKAAYHKNDGVTGNYWDWPTSTDTVPYSDNPGSLNTPDDTNVANFRKDDSIANGYDGGFAVTGSPSENKSSQNYLTDVGAYSLATSPYGIFDQGGNASEWTEGRFGSFARIARGGDWGHNVGILMALNRPSPTVESERDDAGFRVASIPETSLIAGDLDENGVVDGADFLFWQRGDSMDPLSASDLADWETNFGTVPLATGSTAAPEPGTLICSLISVLAGCGCRFAQRLVKHRGKILASAIAR